MRPDGSTITARVAEPKYFFQLPVNVAMLSEDDRRLRLAARKPQMKIVEEVCPFYWSLWTDFSSAIFLLFHRKFDDGIREKN